VTVAHEDTRDPPQVRERRGRFDPLVEVHDDATVYIGRLVHLARYLPDLIAEDF
jgi:hypothetical protein